MGLSMQSTAYNGILQLTNKNERNNAIATRYLESQREKSVRKMP